MLEREANDPGLTARASAQGELGEHRVLKIVLEVIAAPMMLGLVRRESGGEYVSLRQLPLCDEAALESCGVERPR